MSDDELRDDPTPERDPAGEQRPKASIPADRLRSPGERDDDHDDQEEQLWEGGYSSKAMVGSWLMAAVVSIVLLVVGFLVAVGTLPLGGMIGFVVICALIAILWMWLISVYLYRRWSVYYELTNHRFMHKEGILSRRVERIEVIDMDDITCSQGLIERMVGVGTIKIKSSDRTHPELFLKGIENAIEVANLMDDVRRKERRRRALHFESI